MAFLHRLAGAALFAGTTAGTTASTTVVAIAIAIAITGCAPISDARGLGRLARAADRQAQRSAPDASTLGAERNVGVAQRALNDASTTPARPLWQASFPGFCDSQKTRDATQQHRLLRFADAVRGELERSGSQAAIISRSGLNLDRFGILYSHAGISLRDAAQVPWSVRQLYYACDEGRPSIFDQGIAGFLFNSDEIDAGHVSLLLLPEPQARQIRNTALDNRVALSLLAGRYSANAYPFSTMYQNCNQWVIETLAVAMGGLNDGVDPLHGSALRADAQQWLKARNYAPPHIDVTSQWLLFASEFVPMLRFDDHPPEERFDHRYRLSLPVPIETWVRRQVPGTRHIELCRNAQQIVIREQGQPMGPGCTAAPGDRVVNYG